MDRHTPGGPDGIIVSGDLYRARVSSYFPGLPPVILPPGTLASAVSGGEAGGATGGVFQPPTPPIPIFPRSRYHSYLKITQISIPGIVPTGQPCLVTLTAEQFEYTQPPPSQFQGSFPASPTRTVSIVLAQAPPPPFFAFTGGPYFQGRVHEGAVDKGAISLGWVAPSLRRASLVVRQVANTVPPPFVPDGSGGVEHFNTIYARATWNSG